jgi:hypothetical protein
MLVIIMKHRFFSARRRGWRMRLTIARANCFVVPPPIDGKQNRNAEGRSSTGA